VAEDLERIVAMSRWFADVTSSRVEAWRYGTALFRDDFPRRWDSNFLRVERPVGDATAAELATSADALQAHLGHRELVVEDPDDGARLAPGFAALGYEVDRLLWMVLRREPARAAVTAAIDAARAAGADLVWLLADAADWPKELYGKLGFDPIGSCWQFTKPPPDRTYR
jgi:hypothetical protein